MSLRTLKTLRIDESSTKRAGNPAHGSENPIGGTILSPIVVLGATGPIGRAVVRAGVETGRPVIAVAQDVQQLTRLGLDHPGAELALIATTIAAEHDAVRLADALLSQDRNIGAVVDAMTGDAGRGRILDHSVDLMRRALEDDLLPHLSAARHLIPLLSQARRGGRYLIIGGPGSDAPWANYGFRSVAASALRMLACVLHDEARSLDVRVQMLSVATPVRGEVAGRHECAEWPTASAIGRQALQLIDRRDAATDTGGALVAPTARAVVRYVGNVESAAAHTTSKGRTWTDVRSFLETLNLQESNEVKPDETP
jgi:NADP-dependent 3-hydroxy acid dehydrogenase YdfG